MMADLEGVNNVEVHHVAKAINYRAFDRKLFGWISGHTLIVLRRILVSIPVGTGLVLCLLSRATFSAPASAVVPSTILPTVQDTIRVNREPVCEATLENFQACAQNGDIAHVRRMAARKPALITERDAQGTTALHVAVFVRTPEVAAFLIEKGADVSALDQQGQTPLHRAVTYHPRDMGTSSRFW